MKSLANEDGIELLVTVSYNLGKEEYICEVADNDQKAAHKLSTHEYDEEGFTY